MVKMGAVWDRTMRFLRANSATVMTIAVIALILPTIVSQVLQLALTGDDPSAGGLVVTGLVGIISGVATILGQIALVALAIDAGLGTGGAFSVAGRRFFPVLGMSILVGLIFLLLVLPIVFIVFAAGGIDFAALSMGDDSALPPLSGGSAMFILLYMLVMFPLFLWIAARFAVLMPVIVWERLGIGALGRSFRLTSGYALKIVGIFILFGIVFIVASAAVVGVFGAIFALAAGGIQGLTVGAVLLAIVSAVLTAVFTVIYTVFLTKLYKSLIEEREPAAVFE